MEIVFDSSTLILLAKIELLRIISEDYQVIIPKAVKTECTCRDTFDAKLISALIDSHKIEVVMANKKSVDALCRDFRIYIGEAESIAIALKRGLFLAVDDLLTIKACKILNIQFTTAVHLLINIAEKGAIDKEMAGIKLEKLSFYGRYNKRIIDDATKRLKGG
jgi:predicted nucleic acid-binding protein